MWDAAVLVGSPPAPDADRTAEELDVDWAYREFAAPLARLVRSRLRDRGLAEDIVQESFFRAHRAARSFDPARPVWPWLATIALRLCADASRRDQRKDSHLVPVRDGDEPSPEPNVADDLDSVERSARVRAALEALPPRDRDLLLLREVHRMRYEDISIFEDMTLEAVKSATRRARSNFRRAYAATDDAAVVVS
jgi:RNA polymerase sigma-70 factor (ECF subfamily)